MVITRFMYSGLITEEREEA